ncbi:MAG: hypothetical protein AYK19_14120 [Theionarchaea archaeon DG-70-1]|nr:MAG: hypothetical protein AYK19_14120 [Theionarchaea archaeon DG-70-1]
MVKFECPRDSHDLEIDIGEKSGSDEIECDGCGAYLKVTWSDWGEDIEVEVLSVCPIEFECPKCDCDLEIKDIEEESGSSEIECDGCGMHLEVVWSYWGGYFELEILEVPPVRFECPKDSCDLEMDIEEDSGSDDTECDGCGAYLKVTWSDWGENIEIEILGVSMVKFGCPKDSCPLEIKDIEEESGSSEIECDGCGAYLKVTWSDWGEDIEAEILGVPPIEFRCPICRCVLYMHIEEENGRNDIDCRVCDAYLEVAWSDWGEDIEVIPLEYF